MKTAPTELQARIGATNPTRRCARSQQSKRSTIARAFQEVLVHPTNLDNSPNLDRDRNLGAYWERQFCRLAGACGYVILPQQIGRTGAARVFYRDAETWQQRILPDVTLWISTKSEHHEIKHKSPTRRGLYGLERYRFDDLLWFARETKQAVYLTIHNHDLSGGRDGHVNSIAHWVTARIDDLNERWIMRSLSPTWMNGKRATAEVLYWPRHLFQPLAAHFPSRVPPRPSGGAAAIANVSGLLNLAA